MRETVRRMDLKRQVLFSNSLGAVSLLRKVHAFLAITNVYKFSLSVINSVELLSIIFVFTVGLICLEDHLFSPSLSLSFYAPPRGFCLRYGEVLLLVIGSLATTTFQGDARNEIREGLVFM